MTDQPPRPLSEYPDPLTAPEAAKLLRINVRTLRKLVDEGELKGKRLGSEYRVPKSAVAAYLSEESSQPIAVGGGGVFDPEDVPARGMWQPARGARGVSDEGVSGAA